MRAQHPFKFKAIVIGLGLICVAPAHAFDWASLWSSAEQRAATQFEEQQYDELIDNAPDANWRGLGEYRKGDYAGAAKSFEQLRGESEEAGLIDDVQRAMYNQANAHVFEENYQAAIDLFDELIESNPQHDNAIHNRDIAQQLVEQQQQEQQQQEPGEQGEQGEQDDESQSEQSQDQQQDQQSGDSEQSESQESEQGDDQEQDSQSSEQQANGDSQSDDESSEEASASAQEQAAQDAAAAAAMEAERERQADSPQTEEAVASEQAESTVPLTEREQANEQWLRQIPDDPAGLLQRKIQNRHQTDFPKVGNSDKPW